jgi:hypothetical protein
MRHWQTRRWVVTALVAAATVLAIGVPTVLIPNSWFGREIAPTWWAWPVLLATALLAGLLAATYVAAPAAPAPPGDQVSRSGAFGGLLSFLAVGCPVCNKLALIALGSSGAMRWFAPTQPFLAIAGIALLAFALGQRLRGERACRVTQLPSAMNAGP